MTGVSFPGVGIPSPLNRISEDQLVGHSLPNFLYNALMEVIDRGELTEVQACSAEIFSAEILSDALVKTCSLNGPQTVSIVDYFLTLGADPNQPDRSGKRPLEAVLNQLNNQSDSKSVEMGVLKCLLDCPQIQVNVKNIPGESILEVICGMNPIDSKIVDILLQKGAHVAGTNAIQLAQNAGRQSIVHQLYQYKDKENTSPEREFWNRPVLTSFPANWSLFYPPCEPH